MHLAGKVSRELPPARSPSSGRSRREERTFTFAVLLS